MEKFAIETEDSYTVSSINEFEAIRGCPDNCPECGYDRLVVSGHKPAGVWGASCNNPSCDWNTEL